MTSSTVSGAQRNSRKSCPSTCPCSVIAQSERNAGFQYSIRPSSAVIAMPLLAVCSAVWPVRKRSSCSLRSVMSRKKKQRWSVVPSLSRLMETSAGKAEPSVRWQIAWMRTKRFAFSASLIVGSSESSAPPIKPRMLS